MAGGSRRHHTKSKNGCGQCKKRRVKCDCIGPTCKHCKRRGETCDYTLLDSPSPLPTSTTKSSAPAEVPEMIIRFEPILAYQPPHPDLEELELLHHYETTTAITCLLPNRHLLMNAWCYDIPLAARSYDFLMHELLSLAALHKAHLSPSSDTKYNPLALKYHTRASQGFRSSIQTVDNGNSTAVFGFTIVYAIAQFKHCINMIPSSDGGLHSIIDALTALRGSFRLSTQYDTLFRESVFGALPNRMINVTRRPLNQNIALELEALDLLNISSDAPEEEQEICKKAIEDFRQWSYVVEPYPAGWDMVLRWPMTLSDSFLELMKEGRPMPLVIFAHWCIPVHRLAARWFIYGWAEGAIGVIVDALPKSGVWKGALDWVLFEMGFMDLLDIAHFA